MPDGSFNSTDEQRRRGRGSGGVTGKGFQPGVSGCPGGRPRADVTQLARQHTTAAIQALAAALRNPKERVQAAQVLLDRGWGKPQLNIRSEQDISMLHLIAATTHGAELVQSLKSPSELIEQAVIDGTIAPTE